MRTPDWRRLQDVPLFATLPDAGLRRLWDISVPRHYAPAETLRGQGTRADHLLVLLDGIASASATTDAGRVVRFGTRAGPCALDKVALLDGAGHTATFTALTPCGRYRGRTSPRCSTTPRRCAPTSSASSPPRPRPAGTAHRHGHPALRGPSDCLAAGGLSRDGADRHITLPGGQRELADLLGVTRVTVNRALSRLRRDGLIGPVENRGRIHVLAPELLALRAAPDTGQGR